MITFQQESVSSYYEDNHWQQLFEMHYKEIAWKQDKIALKPDLEKYKILEDKGILIMYSAREDGVLIGYAVWMIMPHMHYSDTKIGSNDVLYVHPNKRGGRTGLNLIKYSEVELKKLGVHSILLHIKKSFDWGNVAERIGYEAVDTIYQKWIGE